jgi:hypothetical protein
MARQLTRLEWTYFTAIPNEEFFRSAWSSANRNKAPFIRNYIDRFNQVRVPPCDHVHGDHCEELRSAMADIKFVAQTCYWVATEIVLTPNQKQRSVVIERFIDLAAQCLKLANFNAVMAIHLALNLSSVSRLKASWKGVSAKHLQRLNEICASSPLLHHLLFLHLQSTDVSLSSSLTPTAAITDPSHNYANYRKLVAATKPPMIPFQALNLKELTFIEENVDRLENDWINFEKMALLAKVTVTIAHLQKVAYKFNEVEVVMRYLKQPPIVLGEKELIQRSRLCEPSQDYGGSTIQQHKPATDIGTSSNNNSTLKKRSSNRLTRSLQAVRLSLKNLKDDTFALPTGGGGSHA